jgi:hypothetical protein
MFFFARPQIIKCLEQKYGFFFFILAAAFPVRCLFVDVHVRNSRASDTHLSSDASCCHIPEKKILVCLVCTKEKRAALSACSAERDAPMQRTFLFLG